MMQKQKQGFNTRFILDRLKSRKQQKEGKKSIKETLSLLSKGLMFPVAVLPIAGLLLGIGAQITNVANAAGDEGLAIFATMLTKAGEVAFANLAALFAIAVAFTFTQGSGVAALAGFLGLLVFYQVQNSLADLGSGFDTVKENGGYWFYDISWFNAGSFTNNLSITTLNTSVFGGIVMGALAAWSYNRFKKIELPQAVAFFSGERLVPIVAVVIAIPVAILNLIIWPVIGRGLAEIGRGTAGVRGLDSFVFGYVERALIPFGLHHVFYTPLWFTEAGGSYDGWQFHLTDGSNVIADGAQGDLNIWSTFLANNINFDYSNIEFAVTSDGNYVLFNDIPWNGRVPEYAFSDSTALSGTDITNVSQLNTAISNGDLVNTGTPTQLVHINRFQQGKFPFMIFGLPAAAAAMIFAAKKERRGTAIGVIGSAALTSMLTGITEPIEFSFLFLVPWLYWGVHCFLAAISFMVMNLVGAHVGQTFSGGIFDLFTYGAAPFTLQTKFYWAIILGLIYAPLYFFIFNYAIRKFDIKTPGRDDFEELKLYSKADYKERNKGKEVSQKNQRAFNLVEAFGGQMNIEVVDACASRLRVTIKDKGAVDQARIRALGASGIIFVGRQAQAIYGGKSTILKQEMIEFLGL